MNKSVENTMISIVIIGFFCICIYLHRISDEIINGHSIQNEKSELVILAPPAISNIISEFAKIYTEEQNFDVTVRFLPIEDLVRNITLKKKISNPNIATLVIAPHIDNIIRISNIEHDTIKYGEGQTIHHLWNDNIIAIIKDNSFCPIRKCARFDNIASLLTLVHGANTSSNKLHILDNDDIVRYGIMTLYQSSIARMCHVFANTIVPDTKYMKRDVLIKRKDENDIDIFYTDDEISIVVENKEIVLSKGAISSLAAMQNNDGTKLNIMTDVHNNVFDVRTILINKCLADAEEYYNQYTRTMIGDMVHLNGNIGDVNWNILFGLKSNLHNVGIPILNDSTSIVKIWGMCRNNKRMEKCIDAMNFFLTNDRIKQVLHDQELRTP